LSLFFKLKKSSLDGHVTLGKLRELSGHSCFNSFASKSFGLSRRASFTRADIFNQLF